VEAEHGGATIESPPLWSQVTYQFPKRGARPAVKLVWYDGKKNGVPNRPSDALLEGTDWKPYSALLVGSKGKMFFNNGNTDFLFRGNNLSVDLASIPRSVPRTKNEDFEWLDGIRGGPAPLSNFANSGPFSETVLLGNLAIRTGKKIEWDAKNLRAKNAPEADSFIKRDYRAGYSLG
jgi:hypothetical protein